LFSSGGFDFDDHEDAEGNRQPNKSEKKMENEAILLNMARLTGGTLSPYHKALTLLHHIIVKWVRLAILYRGPLTLGCGQAILRRRFSRDIGSTRSFACMHGHTELQFLQLKKFMLQVPSSLA
jgi:hypothetical protein